MRSRLARGLIPACAGKTGGVSGGLVPCRAHPRVCGENEEGLDCFAEAGGSSPRVRGKLKAFCHFNEHAGLIPACAGKTVAHACPVIVSGAHPRVCGENVECPSVTGERPGSSPRVRGKRLIRTEVDRRVGLIPACAGKTHGNARASAGSAAHPRVCGENDTYDAGEINPSGSSPRVRGKHRPPTGESGAGGLIPACAGKTAFTRRPPRPLRAHPRVCGANV